MRAIDIVIISLDGLPVIRESMSSGRGVIIVVSGTRLIDMMADTHDIHFTHLIML